MADFEEGAATNHKLVLKLELRNADEPIYRCISKSHTVKMV